MLFQNKMKSIFNKIKTSSFKSKKQSKASAENVYPDEKYQFIYSSYLL